MASSSSSSTTTIINQNDVVFNSKGEKLVLPGWNDFLIRKQRNSLNSEANVWIVNCLVKQCDYNLNEAVERFKADRSAWGIVAALIMTIGFSGLMIGPSQYGNNNILHFLTPVCLSITSFSSLLCIYAGTVEYIRINYLGPNDFIRCVLTLNSLGASSYLQVAVYSLIISAILIVFSIYRWYEGLAVTILAMVTIHLVIIHARWFCISDIN
jgi:hypothetical protein